MRQDLRASMLPALERNLPLLEPMSAADATKKADIINILLPDEVQADIYRDHILPNLSDGNILMCSHGFNVHFEQVVPPDGVDVSSRRASLTAPTRRPQ